MHLKRDQSCNVFTNLLTSQFTLTNLDFNALVSFLTKAFPVWALVNTSIHWFQITTANESILLARHILMKIRNSVLTSHICVSRLHHVCSMWSVLTLVVFKCTIKLRCFSVIHSAIKHGTVPSNLSLRSLRQKTATSPLRSPCTLKTDWLRKRPI